MFVIQNCQESSSGVQIPLNVQTEVRAFRIVDGPKKIARDMLHVVQPDRFIAGPICPGSRSSGFSCSRFSPISRSLLRCRNCLTMTDDCFRDRPIMSVLRRRPCSPQGKALVRACHSCPSGLYNFGQNTSRFFRAQYERPAILERQGSLEPQPGNLMTIVNNPFPNCAKQTIADSIEGNDPHRAVKSPGAPHYGWAA